MSDFVNQLIKDSKKELEPINQSWYGDRYVFLLRIIARCCLAMAIMMSEDRQSKSS